MTNKKSIILFLPPTIEGNDRITPPLSLLALAPIVREEGFNPVVVDGRVQKNYEVLIMDEIKSGALLIGMSVMTGPQIKFAREVGKKIKEKYPDFPIVWGGWHGSILPEQTVSDPYVDIVVRGQGEPTFRELLKKIEKKEDLSSVLGITYKLDGKPKTNPARTLESIEEFPYLAFDLVDLKNYPGRRKTPNDVFITYRATQGCPYRCAYCADPLVYNRKWMGMSAKRIVGELKILQDKYGVTEVLLVDDTFVINEQYTIEFARELIKENVKIEWQACARIGTIARMDIESIQLLKDSGCVQLHPGVEVATQDMMEVIMKDEKIENLWLCAEKMAKVGIRALYSFMVTFPEEPDDAISATFEIIKRLKTIDPNNVCPVNFYIPFPGNSLFDMCIRHGFKEPKTLEEWETFNTRSGETTPWITKKQKFEVTMKDRYYMPAAFPSITLQNKMKVPGFIGFVYRTFHFIADYRVNSSNYFFPFDWWILYAYWKFWEKFNKKITLHNITFR